MRNVFSYLRILCLSVFVLSSNLEPARADGNLGIHSAKQATQWRSIESLSITHFNNLSKIDVRLLDPSIRQELEALQWEKSPLRILERERSISEKAQLNFYQKAIEAGVIDPTLTDSTSLDELNKAYHIKRIYALLGSNGRGCLTCIPSPGYPDPMPVNDPIETFPLNLYPLMLRPRATKGAFSNLPGSFSKIGRVNQPFNPVGFTDVVQIFRGKDPLCTGTLVTENRVLTAAHCARPNEHETLTVHVPVESQEALLRCRTAMEIDK